MFVVQAHSFRQQSRLAITLAWIAGYTNIVAIFACGHVISHVSGTTSDLGRYAAEGNLSGAAFVLTLVGAFFVGAVVAGSAIELGRRRGWASIYVLPMAIECTLLAAFALLIDLYAYEQQAQGPALYALGTLGSIAMGLQNATITRISAGVVRTTHVTGVVTDLGLELAQYLSRRWPGRSVSSSATPPGDVARAGHATPLRLALLASILGSFAFGAFLGTLAFEHITRYSMFPPTVFLVWIIWQDLRRPIAEIEASALVTDTGLEVDDRLAVYRLAHRNGTGRGVHRMPNVREWLERVPASARVVVLDLTNVQQIDHNSAIELRTLVRTMRADDRRLLLAGITPEQFVQLRASGVGDELSADDVCPDAELAVARGLGLIADSR